MTPTDGQFLLVSSYESSYHDSPRAAAYAAGAKEWNCYKLIAAIMNLEMGDELSVDNDISIFRISGKDIDYGPQA